MNKRLKITLIVVGAVVSWVLLTVAQTDYSWSLSVSMLLGGLFALLALASIALIAAGLIRWRKRPIIYGLLVATYLASWVFSFNKLGDPSHEWSMEQGNSLVGAIEKYKLDIGKYPDSLGALVPDYIDSVPLARIGLFQRLHYHYSANDSAFHIQFPQPAWMLATYDSRRGKWVIDD